MTFDDRAKWRMLSVQIVEIRIESNEELGASYPFGVLIAIECCQRH